MQCLFYLSYEEVNKYFKMRQQLENVSSLVFRLQGYFYNPIKRQKTIGFLMFSGGIEISVYEDSLVTKRNYPCKKFFFNR